MKGIFSIGTLLLSCFVYANDGGPTLNSKALQKSICRQTAYLYPVHRDWEEYLSNLEDWSDVADLYVEVDLRSCQRQPIYIRKYGNEKVGSKTLLTSLELEFSGATHSCVAQLERGYHVQLNDDGTYEVKLMPWSQPEVSCIKTYDARMASVQIGDKGVVKVLRSDIDNKVLSKIIVPDYLWLGEPDDGAGVSEIDYYSVTRSRKEIGYIVSFIYINEEGEWATRYTFKYNEKGEMLGRLLGSESLDYESVRIEVEPESYPLHYKAREEITRSIRSEISFTDKQGKSWGVHDIFSTELLEFSSLKEVYRFLVRVEAGMGHEYDESSIFSNNTCVVEVFRKKVAEEFTVGKISGCKVILWDGDEDF